MLEPDTVPALLLRLSNHRDSDAWAEFISLYDPLIYTWCRRRGLQPADAADVTQQVLQAVALYIGGMDYRPGRSSFRGWLLTITRSKLANFYNRSARCPTVPTGGELAQQILESCQDGSGSTDEEELWDREYRQQVLRWAMERVQPTCKGKTWEAFWRTAIEGQRGETVAQQLGMTPGAVYLARRRVQQRLRRVVGSLERMGRSPSSRLDTSLGGHRSANSRELSS